MKKIYILFFMLFYQCAITHADITWLPPTIISTLLTDASDPRVVIDSTGNATAAWVENGTIKVSSLPFNGSWSAPVTLSNVLNNASTPKLGLDAAGNVTALWIENAIIQTTTLPFGGSWNPTITPISSSGASKPVLAVDTANNAVAIWVRNGFIESSTRISGSWNPFTVISGANSDNPHIAINNSGNAIAAWRRIISGSYVIVTDQLTISTNIWAASKNVFIGTPAFFHDYPKIAIDENGNATIAWFRYNLANINSYQNIQVIASSLSSGSSAWILPSILSGSGIRNPANLTIKLRVDSNGDVLAVWTNSYDGENFSVESALKIFGEGWPRFILAEVPTLYSFGIDLAYSSGTTLLTNMASDGNSGIQIQSQETDTINPAVQAWSMVNPFSSGNRNGYPQCALSYLADMFNAVAVWIYSDGVNNLINASTGSGPVIAPPSNLSATQNITDFGVYQDNFNTITWEASSDPTVIQYTLFRNGSYFAATDPNTLELVDHNTIPNGTVTYGVAAMLSNYRQSEITSYTLFP